VNFAAKINSWRKAMGWSQIEKIDGLRAGDNWLAELEPAKEQKRRKRLADFQNKIEVALASDKKLSKMFEATLEMTHYTGRVDGLREGLALYEYGLQLEGRTPAFRSVMGYIVRNAIRNPESKPSNKDICEHLDKEIDRITAQKTADVLIRPPKTWGCVTWMNAYENKRNDVDVLFSAARKEAVSPQYCTLRAWKTWGREKQKKVRPKDKSQ
jgi:hypothetical protein